MKLAPIDRTVTTDAVLFAFNQAALAPKIVAPVSKYFVNRGSKVRRGQLLAILENRDLKGAATENQGAYEQAQADYSSATKSTLPEELQKAEADVAAAKRTLDAQEKIFSSRQDLYRQGALPRKELDQSQVDLTKARNDYELASRHLQALKTGVQQDKFKAAQGQLTAARGKYTAAEATLSYSEIRSPISGVVTDRPLFPGDTPTAGEPVVTVMDLSQIIAKAHVPQESATLLKAGDQATISIEGVEQPIAAKLTLVSPALDPNSTTVEIWALAKNPEGIMRPGSAARLTIVAQHIPDAIVVPAAAVLKAPGGEATVMLIGPDGRAHQQAVETGATAGEQVQITKGLKPGDRIVTTGAYGLPDNTKVSLAEAPAEAPTASDGSKPSGKK
ncbi:MAG: efflux RND transporter periplasmic adaptor subunit [Acidobacteriaceae bacterium]|nr:efflux RND transporter periplasmic adaptor subunit [Acidobacteriaceae bacterium]